MQAIDVTCGVCLRKFEVDVSLNSDSSHWCHECAQALIKLTCIRAKLGFELREAIAANLGIVQLILAERLA